MPIASWECQGRQQHGWFGHGTCAGPSGIGGKTGPGCPGCELAQAAALAVAHVPRQDRMRFSSWLDLGGLRDLRELLPQWADAASRGETDAQLWQFADPATLGAMQLEEGFALNLASLTADRGNDAARLVAPLQLAALAKKRDITGISRAGRRPAPVPRAPAAAPSASDEPSARWQQTMDDALRDLRSAQYDPIIRTELDGYNRHFAGTPGFVPLDFRIFKAMLLVESGGPALSHWEKRAFQIGNPTDAGLGVLLRGEEGAALIMIPQLRDEVRQRAMIGLGPRGLDDPTFNIRAGIAYVLTRMVEWHLVSKVDPSNGRFYNHIVRSGDTLTDIAKQVQSTVENLRQNNPGLGGKLAIGQNLIYQKASMEAVISGWRQITPESLKRRYNGGGDPSYARKLEFLTTIIPR